MSSAPIDSVPDASALYEAALHYLARYPATEAGLRRVLVRKIDRWSRAQPDPDTAGPEADGARAAVDRVVERLAAAGAVSDASFAENRARGLIRGGKSSRSVQAYLAAKGVAPDVAKAAAVTDDETELAAALVLARKRRIGPYRADDSTEPGRTAKEFALLARTGFSRTIAERALTTPREDAERLIHDLRR